MSTAWSPCAPAPSSPPRTRGSRTPEHLRGPRQMAELTTTAPAKTNVEDMDAREARKILWNAVKRFLPYMKPHLGWMSISTFMAVLSSITTIAVMYTVMAGIGHIVLGDMEAIRST